MRLCLVHSTDLLGLHVTRSADNPPNLLKRSFCLMYEEGYCQAVLRLLFLIVFVYFSSTLCSIHYTKAHRRPTLKI